MISKIQQELSCLQLMPSSAVCLLCVLYVSAVNLDVGYFKPQRHREHGVGTEKKSDLSQGKKVRTLSPLAQSLKLQGPSLL